MTTVPCSNCGRECSTHLIVCPDCNTPVGYQGGTAVDVVQLAAAPTASEGGVSVIIKHFCGKCEGEVQPDSMFCTSYGTPIAPDSKPGAATPATPAVSARVSPAFSPPPRPDTWSGEWRVARVDNGPGMFMARIVVLLGLLITGSLAYPMLLNWYFSLWAGRLLLGGRSVRYTGTVGGIFGMWLRTLFFILITLGLYWLIRGSGNAKRYLDGHLELA